MALHSDFRYSITIHTDDLPLVYCFRALTHYCQKEVPLNIAWSNTGEKDWESSNHEITFHFTRPEYRKKLIEEANRLFHHLSWKIVCENDNDPASPKR